MTDPTFTEDIRRGDWNCFSEHAVQRKRTSA